MSWDTVVAALLVLSTTFGALAASLGLALLLGGGHWPQAQSDGLRWSGAVSAQATASKRHPASPDQVAAVAFRHEAGGVGTLKTKCEILTTVNVILKLTSS